ncbi:hypothetical protein GFM13_11500 [Rhizobium leguminosarum bv. viciae]|nr:hypothetical protein [Rhizobium leguminosarum bv. viciae]
MKTKTLEEGELYIYFQNLASSLTGRHIKIEIVGSRVGSQILTGSSRLLGITYEPKKKTLEIFVDGLDHIVDHPKSVSIEEDDGALVAMDIVDQSDQHQILTLLK